jgi:GDP-L-fucose synthase
MPDLLYPLTGKRVFVAGHRGMAGSAIVRRLGQEDCTILTVDRAALDLRRQGDVEAWMADNKPHAVFVAAATVGGIIANSTRPAEFLHDNIAIATNVIHAARVVGVEKLLYLSSSCIYPRAAAQPVPEDALLTGALEPTNEWYAIAKIAGIAMCRAYRRQYGCDFIAAVPNNLYGPGDHYDATQSHVAAALMMKIHAAKVSGAETVELWGTGAPLREFLYSDDLGDAMVFLMRHYSGEDWINVGSGDELSIRDLALLIAETVGWQGRLVFDTSKPDGMPRKMLDTGRMAALGWRARTDVRAGMRLAYQAFLAETHG